MSHAAAAGYTAGRRRARQLSIHSIAFTCAGVNADQPTPVTEILNRPGIDTAVGTRLVTHLVTWAERRPDIIADDYLPWLADHYATHPERFTPAAVSWLLTTLAAV